MKNDPKWEMRKIYYSSLLEQKKENESNQIKIAVISIGITIAGIGGIAGTIIGKGIQPFSNLWLLFLIIVAMIIGYAPWLYLLYVVFHKLEIDTKVIDEKIATIGKDNEYDDTENKEQADKLDKRFRISLIVSLIAIVFMAICILISTYFIEGEKMAKEVKTQEVNVSADTKKGPVFEKSQGGKLPGFFQIDNQTGNTESQPGETSGQNNPNDRNNPNDQNEGASTTEAAGSESQGKTATKKGKTD